ncbi:MAG: Tex family protein [Anaerovoracaceae bacterium]
MNEIRKISQEFSISEIIAGNIIALLDDDNTVPFIARYRKEQTGAMDDQVLREFSERLDYLRSLEKRKEEIFSTIEEQGKLSEELKKEIKAAETLARLEDLYRPYKQKKKTRASVAREKGLEKLAEFILSGKKTPLPFYEAKKYISSEEKIKEFFIKKNELLEKKSESEKTDKHSIFEIKKLEEELVENEEAAILGAIDIIAEDISDDAAVRDVIRIFIEKNALISTKANTEEDSVYSMYYEYEELIKKIPDHRILAINRGEKEGFLKVSFALEKEEAVKLIYNNAELRSAKKSAELSSAKKCQAYEKIKKDSFIEEITSEECLAYAGWDSLDRLILPSIEREKRAELTEMASESAIKLFAENLKNLLMQPPVAGKVTLGVDPAYRTGCKLAVIDGYGKVLATAVIYPTPPASRIEESERKVLELIKKFNIELIAIGNGTASSETEIFIANTLKKVEENRSNRKDDKVNNSRENKNQIAYVIVNEAGASVYSASKLAAKEFPDFDVSLRSAVSIARRLQDPLAELVKIDPKAIGVGQYQHDMPQGKLESALMGTVESCVNSVGVNLNTASSSLLSYVSGISQKLAENIVEFREKEGPFLARKNLMKVPKLGPKAFEQAAGFLRIPEAKNYFDRSGIHPESYKVAEKILKECGITIEEITGIEKNNLLEIAEAKGYKTLAEMTGAGAETVKDIIADLIKPGRDPRSNLQQPVLKTDVMGIEDLYEGMELTGTVRNVIDFGAFVDIGVHQDGLVHISKICDRFIKHPSEVLKLGQVVKVKVLEVDEKKKRISLSMLGLN